MKSVLFYIYYHSIQGLTFYKAWNATTLATKARELRCFDIFVSKSPGYYCSNYTGLEPTVRRLPSDLIRLIAGMV